MKPGEKKKKNGDLFASLKIIFIGFAKKNVFTLLTGKKDSSKMYKMLLVKHDFC